MNDKYVFTDVYVNSEIKNSKIPPHYTLVFENKDITFPLLFKSCEEVSKNNIHYIKRDGKCLEVL
jgi:hypothetical protein